MKIKVTSAQVRAYLGTIIPAGVLTWSLAMLTLSYMGAASKLDSAFISSLVTSVLAAYGITRKEEEKKEQVIATQRKIASPSATGKKRGRPVGSKNKTKAQPPVITPTSNGKT
jgi:hypothetical protein